MNFTDDSSIEPFLKDFEAQYIAQQEAEHPDADATFNYGWALIRSKPVQNVVKGRKLMQDLLSRGYNKTDCLYYVAMADYKLDNALEARKNLETILRVDPECRPAKILLQSVDDKISKDGWVGVGLAGLGIAAVAGVLSAISRK
ncbi:hypothetical protein NDN08_002403 [Rhodosorus marinus]|uniref:Mitochondrial fission 1 protein n=1 Tax=Rhodosorus marinus TaxID=101924 RepID=A0AAV8UTL7_9RHOD|nr:hypothetical protein NDN08_002403 [Rhodosorus marinus]